MTDVRYDQYKDALRRGHVAARRGRLDAAVLAYSEAVELAPDRALPHVSLGGVLLQIDRPAEALAAYDAALGRSAGDEAALGGRAEALAALGRRVDAAEAFDSLASIKEAAGRLPEACDTARRALELAESRQRRRHVEALVRRLRELPDDEAAAVALERALAMLEPMAPPPRQPVPAGSPAAGDGDASPEELASSPEAEPEPAPPPPDGTRLAEEAAELLDRGDTAGARDALVAAAAAHRAAGNANAAVDACYLALEVAPGDAELHLLLARLYVDRGWQVHANEKLRLLDRFTDLTDDRAARREIREFVAALADAADEAQPAT